MPVFLSLEQVYYLRKHSTGLSIRWLRVRIPSPSLSTYGLTSNGHPSDRALCRQLTVNEARPKTDGGRAAAAVWRRRSEWRRWWGRLRPALLTIRYHPHCLGIRHAKPPDVR